MSKKTVFVIIRYSILSVSKAWKLSTTDNLDSYKKKLFSEERLSAKALFFDGLVLPSLQKSIEKAESLNVKVLLYTSAYLPDEHRARLEGLKQTSLNANIFYLTEHQDFHAAVRKDIHELMKNEFADDVYATVRLDDDDALDVGFLTRLEKYIAPGFVNHVVTQPLGYECLYDKNRACLSKSIKIDYPKVAVGLTKIHLFNADKPASTESIYDAGNHTKVDKKHRLINEKSGRMAYVKLAYAEQDTAEAGFARRSKDAEIATEESVLSDFPDIANILKKQL